MRLLASSKFEETEPPTVRFEETVRFPPIWAFEVVARPVVGLENPIV